MTDHELEQGRVLAARISRLKRCLQNESYRFCDDALTKGAQEAIAELALMDIREQIAAAEREFSAL